MFKDVRRRRRFLCTGVEDLAYSGFWATRGIFWCLGWCSGWLPELISSSPEVILELPEGPFGVSEGHFLAFEGDFFSLDSIRSSGFHFPRFFGIIFAVEFIFAATKMILGHIALILTSNSFAACYSIQPARSE